MMVDKKTPRSDYGNDAMSAKESFSGRDPWTIEEMPEDLFDSPLEFIFAEHHRQRQAALILHLVADGGYSRRGVANLMEFIENDFALHVGDEELAFFPILRQQCMPEDNIETLIKRLAQEHKADETIGDDAFGILKRIATGEKIANGDQSRLRVFAEHIRQHLAVENAVLLPIARVRMTEGALKEMAETIKQRHGRSKLRR